MTILPEAVKAPPPKAPQQALTELLFAALDEADYDHPEKTIKQMKEAIGQGADINAPLASRTTSINQPGVRVLEALCEVHHPGKDPLIRAILDLGANPLLGALNEALSEQAWDAVSYMIKTSAEHNHKTPGGGGILHALCAKADGYDDFLPLLSQALEAGADKTEVDNQGASALHALWKNGQWVTPAQAADHVCAEGNPETEQALWQVSDYLFQQGWSLNEADQDGTTVLALIHKQREIGFPAPEDEELPVWRAIRALVNADMLNEDTPSVPRATQRRM